MKIAFAKSSKADTDAMVILAAAEGRLLGQGVRIDSDSGGAITRAVQAASFKGGKGEVLELFGLDKIAARRVAVVGVGAMEKLDGLVAEAVGAAIAARLLTSGEKAVRIVVGDVRSSTLAAAELAARMAYGAVLRSYRFDRYLTKQPEDKKPSLKKMTVVLDDAAAADALYQPLAAVADAIAFTRDLVSEPGNVIYPDSYARAIGKLEKFGLSVEVLDEKDMRKLGMGALLGVGQGSANDSRLVVMEWRGAGDENAQPLAFIGKGVTFDTGGISLKPGAGMEEMKYDMAGSAAVVGLMQALAARKARVNAVGVVALVENMPSHKAQRPGDVVRSMSGQTIEVINTDAEGRLVLADALWYAQDRFKPRFMIDLATLTGAALIALGHEHAAILANDDDLAAKLTAAGQAEGELVWRLPLCETHDKEIDSKIADMKNIAGNRNAGTIIGGQFLQRFVNGVPWVHMDIAGTAWVRKDKATCPAGATGFGVRILDRLVADHFEE